MCTLALYPGWRVVGHPLDTHGGAQYKAEENVYQTILDTIDILGEHVDARRYFAIFRARPILPTGRTVMFGSQTAHSKNYLPQIGASVVRGKKS
jgi:hypothetical protein